MGEPLMGFSYTTVNDPEVWFGANIGGADFLAETMLSIGASTWKENPRIDWASLPETPEDYWDDPDAEEFREYRKARDSIMGVHGNEGSGIPAWKYAWTNDDFVATPEEIHDALARIDRHVVEIDRNNQGFWDRWVAFLREAEKHGGFRTS